MRNEVWALGMIGALAISMIMSSAAAAQGQAPAAARADKPATRADSSSAKVVDDEAGATDDSTSTDCPQGFVLPFGAMSQVLGVALKDFKGMNAGSTAAASATGKCGSENGNSTKSDSTQRDSTAQPSAD